MAAPTALNDEDWTTEQWLAWLRRGPADPVPSYHGLNDCADALEREITVLRKAMIDMASKMPAIPH